MISKSSPKNTKSAPKQFVFLVGKKVCNFDKILRWKLEFLKDPKFLYTIEHADESYRSRCPKEEAKVRFFGHCYCHRRASFQKGHPIVPGSPEHRATGQTEYYAVFRIQLESGEMRTYIGKRALFSWWFFLFVY